MAATRGPWKYDMGNWQVEVEDSRQPIADLVTRHDIGELSGAAIDLDEVTANGFLLAAAPEMKMCCEAALVYLKLEKYLDKTQLIQELERVLAKCEW